MQESVLSPKNDGKNHIYVDISDGIGSSIMINGKIHRGSGGLSGELGHTSIDFDGPVCPCGNRGCLEGYVSMKALKERFGFESYESIVDQAYFGERLARSIITYVSEKLSCAVINAVNLLELDTVILHGEFCYRPKMLAESIESTLNRQSLISRVHPVSVEISALSEESVRASTCAAILDRYFDQKLNKK